MRDMLQDRRLDDPDLIIERGWLACSRSMYAEAESQFERLRRSGTRPVDAARGLSAVLRAQGRPAAAQQLIDHARQDHGDDPSLRRELGHIAYSRHFYDRAAEIFAELVGSDPDNITDRRWLAASFRQAKKYSQARAVLDAAPGMSGVHHGLDLEYGWIAYAEGHYASAAGHFRAAKAHGAPPESFVPPLVKALLRMDRADDAQAEVEAADVRLTSVIAAARADIYVHKGCPRNAIELLLELRAQLDENGLTHLVSLLLGAECDLQARDVFRSWLRERSYRDKDMAGFASPPIVGIWIELAGRDPEVEPAELAEQVESALRRYAKPDSVPAAVAAAAIRAMRKVDTAKATRIAKENADQQPAPVSVLIESAITSFLLCHDYQSALTELDRAIRLQPENERARQWRCRTMRRLGRWEELEAYLDDGDGSVRHSARLQVELGWLRLTQCEYPKAADAFQKACQLDRSSEDALFGLVTALRKLQRWQEAGTVLEKWDSQWCHSSRRRLAAAILALDREDIPASARLFQEVGGVLGPLGQASVLIRQRRAHEACGKLAEAEDKYPDLPGPKIALATILAQEAQDDSRGEDENHRELKRRRADKLCCDAMGRGAESHAAALGCRAHLAAGQGYLRLAESFLDEAQQRNPYGGYTVALAGVLIGMHRVDEAVTMLRNRLKAYPHDSSAYFELHRALHAQGDAKAALGALRSALALATGPGNDPLAVALAYELEEQGYSAEAEHLLRTRLAGGGPAKDDYLRLGLAWILLTRGERAQSPALLEEAVAQASQVLAHPDMASATANPEQIKQDALRCRGTAYYKLAEHERNPAERARLAGLARHDRREQRQTRTEKASRGPRWPVLRAAGLDTVLRVMVLLTALAFTIVLWALHSRNQTVWTTTMVVSLTPLLLAIVLLTALLPQLQTLKLAGLEAQTRQQPEVQLPTSPSVVLPHVTEFAAAASENFVDAEGIPTLVIHDLAVDISDLPEPPTPA